MTAQILRIENAAERQRLQSERTVGRLRGHVAELEGTILEQQEARASSCTWRTRPRSTRCARAALALAEA